MSHKQYDAPFYYTRDTARVYPNNVRQLLLLYRDSILSESYRLSLAGGLTSGMKQPPRKLAHTPFNRKIVFWSM
jgi:hypothetical protein